VGGARSLVGSNGFRVPGIGATLGQMVRPSRVPTTLFCEGVIGAEGFNAKLPLGGSGGTLWYNSEPDVTTKGSQEQ